MSLSGSISGLSRLISLELLYCKELKTLPALPSSIVYINASGCTSLEKLPNLTTTCEKLQELTLSNCHMLAKSQPSKNHLALKLFRSQLEVLLLQGSKNSPLLFLEEMFLGTLPIKIIWEIVSEFKRSNLIPRAMAILIPID